MVWDTFSGSGPGITETYSYNLRSKLIKTNKLCVEKQYSQIPKLRQESLCDFQKSNINTQN